MKIASEPFGITKESIPVTRYILSNDDMEVYVLDYACVIQSIFLKCPDKSRRDVVLGYDNLEGYESGSCFFGSFVGRYANRIKNAVFELNGKTYVLEKNDGPNHLHGSYCRQVFSGNIEDGYLVLKYKSPDKEEGYPGTLDVEVQYGLSEKNELILEYTAKTDADTVINLTNHTYFNFGGQNGSQILNHRLTLDADYFTEADEETLPTGKILPVEGTPMDFRKGKEIGRDIFCKDPQLEMSGGYDHNFIINGNPKEERKFASVSYESIKMDCFTTQPAVQLYTGNFVDGDRAKYGKNKIRYPKYGGFCLETQHYPCSPNFAHFPSTVLKKGDVYKEKTVYRFSFI